jgi:lysine 6-dehydrogenase
MPWTYEGRVRELDYKTLRHPGHFDRMAAMRDLGLFDQEPVQVGGHAVVPRELFHALLRERLSDPAARDLVILKVTCRGVADGAARTVAFEVLDRADPATGFRAMERTTGFSAAAVCALQAQGVVPPGAAPIERALPPDRYLDEVRRRGIAIAVAS